MRIHSAWRRPSTELGYVPNSRLRLDLVGDGDVLALVGSVADEKVVSEAALGGV
jgi:hypothetical protein